MTLTKENTLTINDAARDLSAAARIAREYGEAFLLEGDRPRYALVDLDNTAFFELTEDEKIDIVARRVLNRYRGAFEELAK